MSINSNILKMLDIFHVVHTFCDDFYVCLSDKLEWKKQFPCLHFHLISRILVRYFSFLSHDNQLLDIYLTDIYFTPSAIMWRVAPLDLPASIVVLFLGRNLLNHPISSENLSLSFQSFLDRSLMILLSVLLSAIFGLRGLCTMSH